MIGWIRYALDLEEGVLGFSVQLDNLHVKLLTAVFLLVFVQNWTKQAVELPKREYILIKWNLLRRHILQEP